jgi:hypothetical protein
MRYILIDPVASAVKEGNEPRLAVRDEGMRTHRDALYGLLEVTTAEWVSLPIQPAHDLVLDEYGSFREPVPPTWLFGQAAFLARAVILGVRGQYNVDCRLTVESVRRNVTFGVPPRENRSMEIKSFATVEEMLAFQAERQAVAPRLFVNAPEFIAAPKRAKRD